MIDRVGVVVPAHNEEDLLPACLSALGEASARACVAVHVVVVLDRCSDASLAVATAYPWVTAVELSAGNVGVARAAGVAEVLRWYGDGPVDRLWISTTDADSEVPPNWLSGQLQMARCGWEVIVGTVAVKDWSQHDSTTPNRWEQMYHAVEDHPHIHGANLGFSARAYLDTVGWLLLAADEDIALVTALAHRKVLRTASLPVRTSARRDPRAANGFGDTLSQLLG